jgi:fatty acid desaturase
MADADDFQHLARSAREAGLFYRAPWHAVVRLVVVGLLYGSGWAALCLVGNSWYQLLVAAGLAVMSTQLAFVGHDVGHRQSFPSRRLNRAVGSVCGNLATGISYSYWVTKHNQHHAHPNQVGADPDVGPGVISWTTEQAAAKRGLSRTIARHQAGLFFPLACLEALNLRLASLRDLRSRRDRRAFGEAGLIAVHFAAYLGALFLVLSPLRAVAFIGVQQGMFGLYLACAFAPNHKGMPMPLPGDQLSFVRRQITTSRNVRGGRLLALALGGLNYQIEHHLFPGMPMANLRQCRPLVRAYCADRGIDYCETTLTGSYRAALHHLRLAGKAARAGT